MATLWLIARVGLFIFGLALFYLIVQRLYRHFEAKHPNLGPYRKEGCGECGSCANDSCEKSDKAL